MGADKGANQTRAGCVSGMDLVCRLLRLTSPYMRGADVLAVQRALRAQGFDPGPLDGIYGSRTAGAVRAFQIVNGLPVTGMVGAQEYRYLGVACRVYPGPIVCRHLVVTTPFMNGDDVLAVQLALAARSYDPGPLDGIYGPLTAAAVRAFQRASRLPVTGQVGAADYRALGVACRVFPSPPPPVTCRTLVVRTPYMRGPDVLAVQQALASLGFDVGWVDGIYGPRTAGGVRAFQRSGGLPVTGTVTRTEYVRLRVNCVGYRTGTQMAGAAGAQVLGGAGAQMIGGAGGQVTEGAGTYRSSGSGLTSRSGPTSGSGCGCGRGATVSAPLPTWPRSTRAGGGRLRR